MEQCLIDKEICSKTNQKCKICKLDTCKEVLRMMEDEQYYNDLDKLKRIKRELPNECRDCPFLEIIDLNKQIVYCPYMIKDKCIIRGKDRKD